MYFEKGFPELRPISFVPKLDSMDKLSVKCIDMTKNTFIETYYLVKSWINNV